MLASELKRKLIYAKSYQGQLEKIFTKAENYANDGFSSFSYYFESDIDRNIMNKIVDTLRRNGFRARIVPDTMSVKISWGDESRGNRRLLATDTPVSGSDETAR